MAGGAKKPSYPNLTSATGVSYNCFCVKPREGIPWKNGLKGYSVTAVDRTPFLLKKAQELAQAEGVSVEWVSCGQSVHILRLL